LLLPHRHDGGRDQRHRHRQRHAERLPAARRRRVDRRLRQGRHLRLGSVMSATAPARAVRRAPYRARRLPAAVWLLIAPFLLFFAVTYLAPIVSTIWQSLFTEKSGGGL